MYSNTRDFLSIDRGHLVPAETYSFAKDKIRSTFVYTNAVPQYATFNEGQWSDFEAKIRNYGKNKCGRGLAKLYLLTGISDIKITFSNETIIMFKKGKVKRVPLEPKIVIPNSMWTAGCCVEDKEVVGSFAVIGNNSPIKDEIYMEKLPVESLEEIIGGINLFPGNDDCNDINKDVGEEDMLPNKPTIF